MCITNPDFRQVHYIEAKRHIREIVKHLTAQASEKRTNFPDSQIQIRLRHFLDSVPDAWATLTIGLYVPFFFENRLGLAK
jgi:ribosomal protein RSM22 (predicted rRNA methylase)